MSRISIGASLVILGLAGCTSPASDVQGGFDKLDRIGDEVAIGEGLGLDPAVDLAFEDEASVEPWSDDLPTATGSHVVVAVDAFDAGEPLPSDGIVTHVFDDSDMTDNGVLPPEDSAEL